MRLLGEKMFIMWIKRSCAIIAEQMITMFQLIYGLWYVCKLTRPIVTVFGSARLSQDDHYSKVTQDLTLKLVTYDISVLTGGGPGLMEAANCGVLLHENGKKFRTMGIGVKGLGEGANVCVQKYIAMRNFSVRKWLLTRYSDGFAVMPGGFGTLDELSEVTTLIQTNRIKAKPIVLIGKEYWQPLVDWIMNSALPKGLVSKEDIRLLDVTDDLDEAVCLLRGRCDLILPEELI